MYQSNPWFCVLVPHTGHGDGPYTIRNKGERRSCQTSNGVKIISLLQRRFTPTNNLRVVSQGIHYLANVRNDHKCLDQVIEVLSKATSRKTHKSSPKIKSTLEYYE